MSNINIYEERGYKSRNSYLKGLAFDYDISEEVVFMLANMLGPSEDFDALILYLEEYCENFG